MQNNTFHKQRRGLSQTQVVFCSHLWKSTFSTKWMKNSATPDLLIQRQKGNGSVALTDYKLCFPAASLKQKPPEKCKATLQVSERNDKLTSRRQQQCTGLPTCSSSVISAHSPQRRLLTNLGHRTLSVHILAYLYKRKDDSWVYLWMIRLYLYIQITKKSKAYGFTFFHLGRKPQAHISPSCHTAWVITCTYVSQKWGQNM